MLRRRLDALVGAACQLALAIFFRRVEVVGRDRIPAGPKIVVGNHVNGLIDPLFVLGPLRQPARLLGKSTLWKIPLLAQLLDLAGVIPVYRRIDAGEDPARNLESFARCREELAAGRTLAIFPEGISHDAPQLQPLRTGAARIAIETGLERGATGLAIVPVGLVFEARERFRSRALVVVGEPLDPAPEVAAARADGVAAVRALTARISEALAGVTLNYASWEEARWIEIGVDLFDRDTRDLPRGRRLEAEFLARRALARGLGELRDHHPDEVAGAIRAVRAYDRLLSACGLTAAQVAARWRLGPALALAARTLLRILVAAPVALYGILLNLVPYHLVAAIAARVRDEPNQQATYKLFPSLVVYPALWLAEGLAVGAWLGASAGAAVALSAPFAGYVALRFEERREALWRETRAFLLLRGRRGVAAELERRRAAVEQAIDGLVARWRSLQSGASPTSRA